MNSTKINEEQRQQYRDEGFFVIESALDGFQLEFLQQECDRMRIETELAMAEESISARGITHQGSRYFISNRHRDNPSLRPYIFSELMAEICRNTLGPSAYLFHEQFVVRTNIRKN